MSSAARHKVDPTATVSHCGCSQFELLCEVFPLWSRKVRNEIFSFVGLELGLGFDLGLGLGLELGLEFGFKLGLEPALGLEREQVRHR